MINEFMQLAKALPLEGLKENRLRSLPKNADAYRVWLTRDGKISDVELLSEETRQSLRKYAPNNQYSFPAFNQLVVVGCDREHAKEREKAIDGIRRNLIDFPKMAKFDLKKVAECACEEETLGRMFRAFSAIASEETFLDELVQNFERKGFAVDPKKAVSLFLDIVDYVEYPMSHKHSLERLNDLLCKSTTEAANQLEVDAFGTSITGSEKLMRSLDVPHWGTVKLRSSNSDIPSLMRYGLTESKSFPIGTLSRGEIETAFQHVFDEANEGFTYSRMGKEEILIAYPADVVSRQKTPLVQMFGGGSNPERERLVFRKVAQDVIELLKGEGRDLSNRELRIFSIRKMDKARTKVVYYRNIDVTALARASEEWNEGCHNLPTLDVKDWPTISKGERKSEKDKKPLPVEIETVFPARLYRYLNKYYKRNFSTEDIEVARFEPSTGLELMLMDEASVVPFVQSILSQVMIQAGNYYRALCVSLGQNKVASAKDKGLHLGIIGLLLYKVGKRKENYMNETAFLLGRFLRIADGLHRCYCDSERKGQYPGEFCGSSLISAMMENPVVALAQFGQRSAPYVKWAQACQKEKYEGLAHWWLNQWQPIADALHATKLSTRLTDAERAELFLGYLSSLPKKEKAQEPTDNLGTENNEQTKENN